MNITVLGAGAWGTAIAVSLSARHPIVLWGNDPAQCRRIAAERLNQRFLPDVALPEAVVVEGDFDAALASAELVLVATPTAALREMLVRIASMRKPVVWLCKGFEPQRALLAHQIAEHFDIVLGTEDDKSIELAGVDERWLMTGSRWGGIHGV